MVNTYSIIALKAFTKPAYAQDSYKKVHKTCTCPGLLRIQIIFGNYQASPVEVLYRVVHLITWACA